MRAKITKILVSLPRVGEFTTLQNWDPTQILTMPIDTVPYSTIQYRTVPYSTPYFLQLTEMFDEDSAEDHLAVLMPGMPKIVVVNGAMALVSSLKVAHWEVVAEVYPCNTHNSHFGWPCR